MHWKVAGLGSPRVSKKDKELAESRFEGSQVSLWDRVIKAPARPMECIRNFECIRRKKRKVTAHCIDVLLYAGQNF